MVVNSVNNVNNNKSKVYSIGAGAVAGIGAGTYGYFSKPYLKNGEFTDKFIKNVGANLLETAPKGFKEARESSLKFLKDIENVNDKESLKELVKNFLDGSKKFVESQDFPDEIKALFKQDLRADFGIIEEVGVDNYKKFIKEVVDAVNELGTAIVKDSIESCFDESKKLKFDENLVSKEHFAAVKKAVKEANLKAAGLWGGITAAVVGLGTYLLTNNNKKA